ncbi:MAG TPA: TRAP transporter large permease subunit [Dehalococcoidia bacterium]|nr:TRAP transporter large permease subunit [Dehalococcoidia bacterium]
MIELSAELATILLFGGILVGVLLGYPLAISVGAVGLIVGLAMFGPGIIGDMYYNRMFNQVTNYILLAVPFFIFMGTMLEKTGVAEQLYNAMFLWFGGLRGGLAVTTILIGTIMAACVGVIAASTMMLALVGIPAMLKRGYSKSLATGCVCAGGTLGILIPPSIMLVVYGPMANLGVGGLFFGAFIPGFLLSGLYVMYILVWSLLHPNDAPPVSKEERAVPFLERTWMLAKALVPPGALILAVLGSIFFGIAAPTEAAAVGALAATVLAVAYRKFSFKALMDTALTTIKHSGMILLIASLAFAFVGVFIRARGGSVVTNFLLSAPGGRWGVFFIIMFICFVLGMFIDWIGIVFIMVPIITPIAAELGFDPLWFGMMICINLQMSFLTPPFAYAIFFVKAASPPEFGVETDDVIRGVIPYIILIAIALVLCIIFPQIILWLPGKML